MSIMEITTRISHRWLERKPKHELASIIMNNIGAIDLFAVGRGVETLLGRCTQYACSQDHDAQFMVTFSAKAPDGKATWAACFHNTNHMEAGSTLEEALTKLVSRL